MPCKPVPCKLAARKLMPRKGMTAVWGSNVLEPNVLEPKFKAAAFDMDGLMFDTEAVYWKAAEALLGRRGCPYTEELNEAIMGRPPRYCFETFIAWFGFTETWEELQAESEALFFRFLDEDFRVMPGLYDLLDRLEKAGIPKGVCTSSSARVADAVLTRSGLKNRFAFLLTSESIQRGKPDPQVYLLAAEKFGVSPADMLVLEDSTAGVRAAAAAGAVCYAVRAEHNKNADLSSAREVLSSLADVDLGLS